MAKFDTTFWNDSKKLFVFRPRKTRMRQAASSNSNSHFIYPKHLACSKHLSSTFSLLLCPCGKFGPN